MSLSLLRKKTTLTDAASTGWHLSDEPIPQQSQPSQPFDSPLHDVGGQLPSQGSNTPQQLVGIAFVILGLLILISFFLLPWVSFDSSDMANAARDFVRDSDFAAENGITPNDVAGMGLAFGEIDGCTYTGLQIATRGDGNSDCDDADTDNDDDYEPRFLPLVEHSVAVMPFLGAFIALIGIMTLVSKSSVSDLLIFVLVISFILILFPVVWAQAYNAMLRDALEHEYLEDGSIDTLSDEEREQVDFVTELLIKVFSSSYRTVLHTIVPVIVLITVIVGFFVTEFTRVPIQSPTPF